MEDFRSAIRSGAGMMGTLETHLQRYLEQARIDELREQLATQNYSVSLDVPVGSMRVSLLAEKAGLRVAYEVIASSHLNGMSDEIAGKRMSVLSSGINSFLISVVWLLKITEVEIRSIGDAYRALG